MAILSDTDIRTRMQAGSLVLGGDPARAEHCSYSFLAGRVFPAGKRTRPITLARRPASTEVLVGPGEMIWVRTLEEVELPTDLAGFWWQTNTLSKKGLMLVNMSMVEPGYKGPLACLFVNFGKNQIPINPQTKIAKMVFTQLSSAVTTLFTRRFDLRQYDGDLRELALGHPNTFLQVADLVAGLKDERARAIAELQREAENVKSSTASKLAELRNSALSDFQADTWKSTLKSIGWAGLAILIFTAALAGVGYIQGTLTPDVKAVARAEAENVLSQRVVVSGTPDADVNARILRKIEELDRRVSRAEGAR